MVQTVNDVITGCCGSCTKSDVCKYVAFYQELMEKLPGKIDNIVPADSPFSIDIKCKYYVGCSITSWNGDSGFTKVVPCGTGDVSYRDAVLTVSKNKIEEVFK